MLFTLQCIRDILSSHVRFEWNEDENNIINNEAIVAILIVILKNVMNVIMIAINMIQNSAISSIISTF